MMLETYPPKTAHLREMMLELIRNDSALARRLAGARLVGKIVGWPLSTFDPSLQNSGERVLLVGDAAGLINPLNGEGIQYSLLSARWAAECADDALRRGDFSDASLRSYRERVQRELRFDMAFACMIVECIRNRHLNALWLKMLSAIATRARSDARYAEICGAVLAGLVPSNAALDRHVILQTLDQLLYSSVLATGWSAVRGPRRLIADAVGCVSLVKDTGVALSREPLAMIQWLAGVARQGGELAIEAALHDAHARPKPMASKAQNGERTLRLRL
jgi:flavin-dependent dehydrogenase